MLINFIDATNDANHYTKPPQTTVIIITIVYKFQHGLVPPYLADDCVPVTTVGADVLQSADS